MVYLDNAATTKPAFFTRKYAGGWMNSNTTYANVEKTVLDRARDRIKACLKVGNGKVLFCRCATEAVEWLCKSFAFESFDGQCILCPPSEHDSVYDAVSAHDDGDGEEPQDILYLHQYINQITGKVFNIEKIKKDCFKANKGLFGRYYFGSDFTATIGHAPIPSNLDTFCDAIWFSGHKFYAEKGVGAIWLSDRLFKYLGGSTDSRNEYGLIHGTANVPAILAMTDALEYAVKFDTSYYRELRDYLFHYATSKHLHLIEKVQDGCSAIHAITIPFINADALCNYLASKQIYVGKGSSACADAKDFRVLEVFGYSKEEAEQTIRVSFGKDNTLTDVEALVDGIIKFKEKF